MERRHPMRVHPYQRRSLRPLQMLPEPRSPILRFHSP
ncbi:MAG: hypothetical protein JRJ51_05405 [Deltaproteobacteria bacterium]|nr:hypothetical protein [Deltaproteobacteria bacterium]